MIHTKNTREFSRNIFKCCTYSQILDLRQNPLYGIGWSNSDIVQKMADFVQLVVMCCQGIAMTSDVSHQTIMLLIFFHSNQKLMVRMVTYNLVLYVSRYVKISLP